MISVILFASGIIIGCVITHILTRQNVGRGYFRLEKMPEEEDIYTVNIRLIPDQKLNKIKRIVLTRE